MDISKPLAIVTRHPSIAKDLKNLRRYPQAEKSLDAWERIFCARGLKETPGINRYPGFGEREIYKARVVALGEKSGKAGGYRVIFERRGGTIFCLLILTRHSEYKHEKDLMNLIHARL